MTLMNKCSVNDIHSFGDFFIMPIQEHYLEALPNLTHKKQF